jgi:hypothetical protein
MVTGGDVGVFVGKGMLFGRPLISGNGLFFGRPAAIFEFASFLLVCQRRLNGQYRRT